jgi:hypothetical protein
MTDNIRKAEEAMGFQADTRINLLEEPKTPSRVEDAPSYQRHVAIEWEGGVLWLNMFDFNNVSERPHFCIDVRQFNSAGKVKGEGVFTMARGYRGSIAVQEQNDAAVKGANWDGGYVVCILTDLDGKETHTDDERK